MKSTTQELVEKLLSQIYTAPTLKEVSVTLEELAQNKHFKNHASHIVNDPTLNPGQKTNQLDYVIKNIECSLLYNFFSDLIGANQIWLFDNEKLDYFDEFVKEFQFSTEHIKVLNLTTAIDLSGPQLKAMAKDLSQELGMKVILSYHVNPSIIGGLQIKIDNYIYDFSLRSKFQQFQREWLASLEKTTKLVGRYDPKIQDIE